MEGQDANIDDSSSGGSESSSTEQDFAEAAAEDQQSRNGDGVGPLASRRRSRRWRLGAPPRRPFRRLQEVAAESRANTEWSDVGVVAITSGYGRT